MTPYIVCEIGTHAGDSLGLAKHYIDMAAKAGADAVKFQLYDPASLCTATAPAYWDTDKTQRDALAESKHLTWGRHEHLWRYCQEKGIDYLATPFSVDAVNFLASLSVKYMKIASADITHFPLLKAVAETHIPVLLSTGASTAAEIWEAVKYLGNNGSGPITLLHCSLAYPTPLEQANIARMVELKNRFPHFDVGYSCHCPSNKPMIAAALLGAKVIEKHFTLWNGESGGDHCHAIEPDILADTVRQIDGLLKVIGRGIIAPSEAEEAARKYARRSIVAARDIAAGTVITEDMLAYKRPGTGIPPSLAGQVIGAIAKVDISADTVIEREWIG